ncbi:sensor histidine kinase [Kaarinaea lacus]
MRSYIAVMLIMGLLVVALLVLINISRYADYRAYHNAIAQASTQGVANEITRFVDEKKRLVKLFAANNISLIRQTIENKEDDHYLQQLEAEIAEFFPNYFTVTLTDDNGVPLFEDFDGHVGELCKQDLGMFATTGMQKPRIHPNHEAYHFDVLAPLGDAGEILFVSFHADILGGTLQAAQTPGHQLMLVYENKSKLIEVTADGARINWDRNDYRLSDGEIGRILHETPVNNTVWKAVDLHAPELFSQYRQQLNTQLSVIFISLVVVFTIMLVYLRREERLREAAERHKDEFLSVVSHELRTPLTVIRGALALMAGGKAGEISSKAKDLAARALNNTNRLTFLVDDLLDVRKIESGRMEFCLKETGLKPFLEKCINENRTYGDQHDTTFELQPVVETAKVNIDENRIAQVLANLLSNAAKYGAEKDTVDISVEDSGDSYTISVTDHGPGIPEEFRCRVFSKFAQADASNDRKVKGTGLGLHVVKLIIEHHGGSVGFTTESGKGTTFYFELPKVA